MARRATRVEARARYRERRAAVVEWLRGERSTLPDYLARPAPETAVIRNQLIELNQFGLLTEQTQPGRNAPTRQRAFITGFIPWPIWEELEEVIAAEEHVVAFVQRADIPESRPLGGIAPAIPVTLDLGVPFTFLGYPLTYRPRAHVDRIPIASFQAFDPRWGVPTALFGRLLEFLAANGFKKDLQ